MFAPHSRRSQEPTNRTTDERSDKSDIVVSPLTRHFLEAAGHPDYSTPAPGVQAKLEVSQPDDPFEREADAIAERVVSGKSAENHAGGHTGSDQVQRTLYDEDKDVPNDMVMAKTEGQCPDCEQKKSESKDVEFCPKCEKEKAQREADRGTGVQTAPSGFSASLSRVGTGRPLPPEVLGEMSVAFGKPMDHVRVHADAEADRLSRRINAKAFTHQNDIFFKQGQFNAETKEGKRLLAHEMQHTLQQGGDKIKRASGEEGMEKDENEMSTVAMDSSGNAKTPDECDSWWPFSTALFDGGRVKFEGWNAGELKNFALMPEDPLPDKTCPTRSVYSNNSWYYDIDGVYSAYLDHDQWIKVPGHCAAIVYKDSGSLSVCGWCNTVASWFKGSIRISRDWHCSDNPF